MCRLVNEQSQRPKNRAEQRERCGEAESWLGYKSVSKRFKHFMKHSSEHRPDMERDSTNLPRHGCPPKLAKQGGES